MSRFASETRLANVLPPLFILTNVGTIWWVYIFYHLTPMLLVPEQQAVAGQQLVISQILVVLFLICFIRAVVTNPGSVPDTTAWRMGGGIVTSSIVTRELKVTGERRHCKWCLKFKPDRCHHCRMCRSCVLKMDHHCPWIMNCVGFNNHKFFFLVVNYAIVTCAYYGYTVFWSVKASVEIDMAHLDRFLLVLCLMLTIIMGTLMTLFGSFHYWLMFRGITTIEYCEKVSVETSGMTYKGSLYDRGMYENMKAVLGPRVIFWALPFDRPIGDGITFEISDAFESNGKANTDASALNAQ